MPGATILFSLEPRPVEVMKPLTARLTSLGKPIETAKIEILGVNMAMGKIQANLVADTDGVLVAQTMLPICTAQRMDWELKLLFRVSDQGYLVTFPFSTNQ